MSVTLSCNADGIALSIKVERRPMTWTEKNERDRAASLEDYERMLKGELPLDPFRREMELKARRMEAEADVLREARRKAKARADSVIGRVLGAVKAWLSPPVHLRCREITNAGRRCKNPPKECPELCGTHLNFVARNGDSALKMAMA